MSYKEESDKRSSQHAQEAVYQLARDRYIQRLNATIQTLKQDPNARFVGWCALVVSVLVPMDKAIDILIKLHILN